MNHRKRLRDYQVSSFENFKANEFIDYMMVATEDEKKMWIEIWAKHYVYQERWWEWIKEGECIRLCSINRKNILVESFCVSRLSTDVPRMIVENPWIKTEQPYANANSTFWFLIFIHLDTVNDVQSFSQVSQTHYRVSRKDEAYRPWIDEKIYYNPFEGQPLWSQFLKLSGRPYDSWKEWVKTDPKCFFYYIISLGGYGFKPITSDFKYDEKAWTIFHPNGPKYAWRDPKHPEAFWIKPYTDIGSEIKFINTTHMTRMTERIMKNKKVC